MNRANGVTMRVMARLHIWLGWLIGVPLLLWTVSGLVMVVVPIETVRGDHLKAEAPVLAAIAPVAPILEGRPVARLTLAQQGGQAVWLIDYADGDTRRADGLTGQLMPGVDAGEAAQIAAANFTGAAEMQSMRRFSGNNPPGDLRLDRPVWQAHFADDTNVYIDAETGAVLGTRTPWWRVFDFMWGLHIMDLQTRADTSRPILIGFAALATIGTFIGLFLLFRRRKPRRRQT